MYRVRLMPEDTFMPANTHLLQNSSFPVNIDYYTRKNNIVVK